MTTNERWVSVEDAAKLLGVARDSVHRWVEGRRPPALRIGRLSKCELSEVDEWVRERGANAGGVPELAPTPKRGGRR